MKLNARLAKRTLFSICLALGSLLGIQTAQGLTTNLLPMADTFLRDQAASTTNFGGDNPLLVGIAKEPFFIQNRGLLKFSIADLPANAIITGVTLTIVIIRSNTDPSYFDLNRMLVGWDEFQTTWDNRLTSTPWLAGGCQSGTEYVSAASVTAEIDATIFSSAGMVSDVQLWLNNPGTNFGWIMIATGDLTGTGKQIGSRESEFYSPVLTVDYILSPPPAATPPILFGTALGANGFRFSFNAQSNRIYSVEFRDSLQATNWNFLATIPAQPVNRTISVTNAVTSGARFFRVRTP